MQFKACCPNCQTTTTYTFTVQAELPPPRIVEDTELYSNQVPVPDFIQKIIIRRRNQYGSIESYLSHPG